jgi:NADH:ubiquinone oxidoreductase subunit 3 (subunit A)
VIEPLLALCYTNLVKFFVTVILLTVFEIVATGFPIASPFKQILQVGVPTVVLFALAGLGRKGNL